MRIQHNLSAMNSLSQYHGNNSALSNNLEKLSSGYKINTAADDAAGLAISEKMRSQIAGLEKAQDNANDGISLVQTAEGALKEVNSMLTRLKTLATQSANGTYENGVDRANIQEEADALLSEIDRISESTNFNGINLLDGSLDGKSQVSNVALDDTNAVAGKYTQGVAFGNGTNALTDLTKEDIGKTIDFSVTWKNAAGEEKTTTVSLTYQGQGDGTSADMKTPSTLSTNAPKNYFTDDTGKKYKLENDGKLSQTNIESAFKAGLKADEEFSSAFKVDLDSTNHKLTFEANEKGSAGAVVVSTTVKNNLSAKDADVTTAIAGGGNATVSSVAQNAMQRMSVNDITYVDNSATAASISAATFEIDGSKFLAVSDDFSDDKLKELDSDITVIKLAQNDKNTTDHTLNDSAAQNVAAIIEKQTGRATEGFNTDGAGSGLAANEKYDKNLTKINAGDIIFEDNTNRLKTSGKDLSLQVGDTNADFQKVSVKIQDMSAKGLGLKGLDLSNQEGAGAAIDTIKTAVDKVSMQRGQLGALQNRLDHTLNNLDATEQNISAAESQIRDTDMAKEMTQYSKNNILAQAAQSMLAQANSMPQGVLSLLG